MTKKERGLRHEVGNGIHFVPSRLSWVGEEERGRGIEPPVPQRTVDPATEDGSVCSALCLAIPVCRLSRRFMGVVLSTLSHFKSGDRCRNSKATRCASSCLEMGFPVVRKSNWNTKDKMGKEALQLYMFLFFFLFLSLSLLASLNCSSLTRLHLIS